MAPEAAAALRSATAAATKQPSKATARLVLGRLYHAHGYEELADSCYVAGITLGADSAEPHYLRGLCLAELGDYERAIAATDAALSRADYAPAAWKSGFWVLDRGDLAGAQRRFDLALDLDPSAAAAMVGLARVYLQREQAASAATMLEDLGDRGGRHPYVSYLLGRAYRQLGRDDEAAPLLRYGGSGPPRYEDPWMDNVRAMRLGYEASMSRAIAKLDGGDVSGALRDLQSLQRAYPRDPDLLNNLGNVQMQIGALDEATATLQSAIRIDAGHAPSHLTLADVFMRRGNLDRAAAHADRAIELRPTMSQAHAQRGRVSVAQRQPQEALGYLQRAIDIGIDDPSTRELLAVVLLDLGEPSEALRHFQIVLGADAVRPQSLGGCAIALARLGRRVEAEAILADALASLGNHPALQRAVDIVSGRGNQ